MGDINLCLWTNLILQKAFDANAGVERAKKKGNIDKKVQAQHSLHNQETGKSVSKKRSGKDGINEEKDKKVTKQKVSRRTRWSDDCERPFKTLKSRLCSSPVAYLPQTDLPYVLRTYASDYGLGAVLLQDQSQGLRPVAKASRKLLKAEKSYSAIEKECLGIIWGMEKFEPYLRGATFILETGHRPIAHLVSNPRLMHWTLRLQKFDYSVRVIPGKYDVGADY